MAGTPFDEAWEEIVGEVVRRRPTVDEKGRFFDGIDIVGGKLKWPHNTVHRKAWKTILSEPRQREVWRSAYEQSVSKHDRQLMTVASSAVAA